MVMALSTAFGHGALAQEEGAIAVTGEVQDISRALRPLDVPVDDGNVWRDVTLVGGNASMTLELVIEGSRLMGAGPFGFGRTSDVAPAVSQIGAGGDVTPLLVEPRRTGRGWSATVEIGAGETLRVGFGFPEEIGRPAVAVATPAALAAQDAVEARLRGVLFGAALTLIAFLIAQGMLHRRGFYFSGLLVAGSLAAFIATSAGWHEQLNTLFDGLLDGAPGAALMAFLAFGVDFARRAMQLRDLSPLPNQIGRGLIVLALVLALACIAFPALVPVTAPFAVLATLATGVVVVEGTRQNVDGPKLILGPWLLFGLAAVIASGLALIAPPRFGAGGVLLVQGLLTAGSVAAALAISRLTETVPPAVQGIRDTGEGQVRGSDRRLANAISGARKGVWDWKIGGDRLYLSREAMALLGFDNQGGEGSEEAFHARVHAEDQAAYRAKLRTEVEEGRGHFTHEMRVLDEHGNYRRLRLEAEVSGGRTKSAARITGLLSDVTSDHEQESPGTGGTLKDALTGLGSRALFMDRLKLAQRRDGVNPALIVMNVDRFQSIIDGVGHAGGDTLLIVLARRLEGVLPRRAFAARLGPDEFGVLIEDDTDPRKVFDLAETIRDILTEALEIDDEEIFPSLSFGIAFSGSSEDGEPPVLRRAEIAMYHGKGDGGGRIETYRPEFAKQKSDLMSLESGLNRALERKEIELLYQPVFSVTEGRLAGFEALMRWNHPERGLLLPEAFLSLAEETGAIVPLGRYVVGAAATQLLAWQRAHQRDTPLFVGVNLSARQILHHDLARDVERMLKGVDLARRSLIVEVTEAVVMEDPSLAERRLEALASEGLGLALDDFGTGYSSLSHLARIAFDKLKIDRAFIETMEADEKTRMIVESTIDLAHALGISVVAEGLQSEEQLRMLSKMGCDYAQGFLVGKPMTAAEAERLIQTDQKASKPAGDTRQPRLDLDAPGGSDES
jgi:diguanylate cyclase (GGDEF)-like protein